MTAMSTDFSTNTLAMRKRVYYIMVELATLHEQCRSLLLRRGQLVEEGEFIADTLRALPEIPGVGMDTMVP
jgi:hypothetical protein